MSGAVHGTRGALPRAVTCVAANRRSARRPALRRQHLV